MTSREINNTENTKPIEENPERFLDEFRRSSWYRDAFEDFYLGKSLATDVTEKEKTEVFEFSNEVKVALVNFTHYVMGFSYNPIFYDEIIKQDIDKYLDHVQITKNSPTSLSRDELETMDLQRSIYHMRLAKSLTEGGITPNEKLGRALGKLILVEKGLETYEQAAEPDIDRIRRGIV